MKRVILFIAIIVWMIPNSLKAQVSESKHDYTELALQITEGCSTPLEQARNIYRWICRNIAYDTTHRVYTADECYKQRKGICQGYCELFYRLGEPLGLKSTIISGRAKDQHGKIERAKHAWILVETDEGNILIDPTWGAGSVKDGKFIFSNNDMSWFQTDPHWLIFTHYPDKAEYQFIEEPIDWNTFLSLPALYPSSTEYGWDGKKVLNNLQKGDIRSLPKIYDQYSSHLSFIDIPMQQTLQAGQLYSFTIQKKTDNDIVLIHDGEFIHEPEWQVNDSTLSLKYMPVAAGTLTLGITKEDKKYNGVVVYQVNAPTPSDLKNIEKHSPLRMPEIKKLKNVDLKKWETIEVNAHQMLDAVRQQKITSLPVLYKHADQYLRGVRIPFSGTLKTGQSYTLSFIPTGGLEWKVINGKDWYDNWIIDPITGRHTMKITPLQPEKLRISVRLTEGKAFESMVGYEVR